MCRFPEARGSGFSFWGLFFGRKQFDDVRNTTMRRKRLFVIAVCAVVSLRATVDSDTPARSAMLAVTPENALLVANPDSSSVSVVEIGSLQLRREIRVCEQPRAVAAGERHAWVACGDGQIVAFDPETGQVAAARDAGMELGGVVTDGTRLFVTDHGTHRLYALDAATLETLAVAETEPWPRGIALTGGKLYVTHFRSGRLSVIDAATLAIEDVISTGLDSNLSHSVTIHGGRAYLPQTRSNSANAALLFDTTVFPIVSVIDLQTRANLPRDRFSMDVVDQPVNMPFDAAVTASGKLYVVHAGSNDLSVVDLDIRRTVAHLETGRHPRGVILSPDEHLAFVNNTLSGDLTVIDTTADQVIATIPVTRIPLPRRVLNGKILFHSSSDARLAKDRWISCATCHFEGGADGHTWVLRDGPRNTTALFGVRQTLPMHWSGDLDELHDVEQTVRVLQAGTGLIDGDLRCDPACDQDEPHAGRSSALDDLAAFMASLRPPRRGFEETEAAARGRKLFLSSRTDCRSCHPPPLFTDRRKHDVGTGNGSQERKGAAFDTPSLRSLYDTAPYFHDGSAATLADVLERHGDTQSLLEHERRDLIEFLRTIPFGTTRRRAVR
jgi:YVTN family beta-propeller protein